MTEILIAAVALALIVLCGLVVFGYIPHLRLVPDNTKFDFMRFRRVSFPVSALLSVLAIVLFFTHGLNFGIDFKGGTLIEVQAKSGTADLARMRDELGKLNLGEFQLQQFGGPDEVLIRIAQQPGGDAAQQAAVEKVRGVLGDEVEYRRVEVVGPRVSGELLVDGRDRHLRRDRRHPDLSLVPVRMAVRARRDDRQHPRHCAHYRLHVGDADRLRPHQHRGAADHPRLFAQRHRRHLRPYPRDAAALQEAVDGGSAERLDQRDAVALDHHPRHRRSRCSRCSCSAARRSTASPRP